MFEVLGIVGIGISVAAYVPQVIHLWIAHCSAGVSSPAWTMWLASGLLVGALALHRQDPVFIALQVSSLTSATVILFLARRYRGQACATHARLVPCGPPAAAGRDGARA
ncbi:MAG: PQ-loop domain-containing transporter [Egibacteraceae bacterium]